MTQSGDERQRERDVWWKLGRKWGWKRRTPKDKETSALMKPIKYFGFLYVNWIQQNLWQASVTPVRLIGLIQVSASLKAECSALKQHLKPGKAILPNLVAQLLPDFKELLWD